MDIYRNLQQTKQSPNIPGKYKMDLRSHRSIARIRWGMEFQVSKIQIFQQF